METPEVLNHAATPIRVLALLNGDIKKYGSDAAIKYGQLFDALAAQTHLVDVCDIELHGWDRYENALRALRWPKRRWKEAFYKNVWAFHRRSSKAKALVRRYRDQIDVVFQHGTLFSAFSAADGAAGPPVVIYADFTYRLAQREDPWRDPFRSEAERSAWDDLEAQAYHSAAVLFTRSEYTRQSMIHDYRVDPARVVAVGGGINFDVLPEQNSMLDAPRILFVGRDFERKGGPELLEAFRRVRQQVPEAELWLLTDAPDPSMPGVWRIAPTRDRAEVAALYQSCSVFAMPSRCETWGDVFLEAMAYGLPCIGTTNNAMPEIIEHDVTGYVVAPGDIAGLAMYLERLMRRPELRRQLGTAGRRRVHHRFTWESVVRRMVPSIERVTPIRANAFT